MPDGSSRMLRGPLYHTADKRASAKWRIPASAGWATRARFQFHRRSAAEQGSAWQFAAHCEGLSKLLAGCSRKGGYGLGADPGDVLWRRLREHAKSIEKADNLRIEDFKCRYLVVDDIWIPLGESLLIEAFNPLWNRLVDGFGNHDPGKGRYNQMRSAWDVLHPGRPWAYKCAENPKKEDDYIRDIAFFFEKTYVKDPS